MHEEDVDFGCVFKETRMQNATSNAKEIIEDLKLEYNKTRQAKITSEILDITGASAGAN